MAIDDTINQYIEKNVEKRAHRSEFVMINNDKFSICGHQREWDLRDNIKKE